MTNPSQDNYLQDQSQEAHIQQQHSKDQKGLSQNPVTIQSTSENQNDQFGQFGQFGKFQQNQAESAIKTTHEDDCKQQSISSKEVQQNISHQPQSQIASNQSSIFSPEYQNELMKKLKIVEQERSQKSASILSQGKSQFSRNQNIVNLNNQNKHIEDSVGFQSNIELKDMSKMSIPQRFLEKIPDYSFMFNKELL